MDIIKLLVVFVLMVVLLMRRVHLGAVMAGISVLLGLFFQLDLTGFGKVVSMTLTSFSNLNLIATLALIMMMEEILRQGGILQRMVSALRGLVGKPQVVMATLPALVGLLPSAGGAIFSAPMIEEVIQGSGATAERKSFINYWYRHIWECVSPIYPAVLMTIQIFEQPLASVILLLLPTPIIAILAGWPTAFRGLTFQQIHPGDPQSRQHLRDLAAGLAPIIIVLLLVLILRMDVAAAVAVVVLGLVFLHHYKPMKLLPMVRKAVSVNVLLSVAAVLFFKEMLIATKAVAMLAPLLTATHFPVIGLFVALPFLVGMLTGAPQAFVGTAAPILISLMGASVVSPAMVAIVVVSGYGGVMLSPVHLCLVLTTAYFKADLGKVYRMVIVPELVLVGLTLFYLAFL
jgi:integral membrane protein (TIGR00529 family)